MFFVTSPEVFGLLGHNGAGKTWLGRSFLEELGVVVHRGPPSSAL